MNLHSDPKIDRISASWLALADADAAWLASVADEITVAPGRRIGDHGFGYVSLEADATIATSAEPATFDRPTRVLAVSATDLARLRAASPTLRPLTTAA